MGCVLHRVRGGDGFLGGQLFLGLPRRRALLTMTLLLAVAVPTWAGLVPAWIGVGFALPIWLWGQQDLRRQTSWGWSPLLPLWGELLPGGGRGARR